MQDEVKVKGQGEVDTQENEVKTGMQGEGARDELGALRLAEYTEPIDDVVRLLSQSRRAFVLGAGCSKCAGLPLMEELTVEVLRDLPVGDPAKGILQGIEDNFSGTSNCQIEDYMSELVDFISIAGRRVARCANETAIEIGKKAYEEADLRGALASIKKVVEQIMIGRQVRIHQHREFIRAVHGRLQAGKDGTVDYFTLNYDTVIEDALALERVPFADGFNGGATGWWTGGAYGEVAVEARVYKVHGSIDWCLLDDDVLPRRIRHSLKEGDTKEPVLIWPASTKYREAQRDPFAQILNMMRKTLRPPQNSEVILAVIGYSFNDAHINEELDRALKEADGRLTILVFTNMVEPEGLLAEWRGDPILRGRVRIHARRGFFHGDEEIKSPGDLPWWKFEVLVRILGGER